MRFLLLVVERVVVGGYVGVQAAGRAGRHGGANLRLDALGDLRMGAQELLGVLAFQLSQAYCF